MPAESAIMMPRTHQNCAGSPPGKCGSLTFIPYMPVSAKIDISGKPALTVKLSPSFGREGFHYDAPVSIPADAKRITLTIGPTTMRLDQGAPESLKRAQTVAFDLK